MRFGGDGGGRDDDLHQSSWQDETLKMLHPNAFLWFLNRFLDK